MKALRIILSIIAIIVAVFGYIIWNGTGFRYIQNETNIVLPSGIKNTKTYDNGEFYTIGYTEIPKSKIDTFIKQYEFKQISIKQNEPALSMWTMFEHKKDFPQIQDDKSLFYLVGKRDRWPWEYLLNSSTGQLWVYINYPDFAGD